jgi:UDP-N-acetylglucosamine diphosphorylase / glucose-1-phosphate thymidylyltransferase / UDP-N-acetylgalactosamine diphosphorylase / glucosamine-1-phosphate N-acetyltransferase / galactosamine-1-phosphate N-acetyltransferase
VPEGVLVIGARDRVLVDHDATIYAGATLDVEDGPIWIGGGAVLRPGAVVVGPAAVGPHSTVSEHAVIRPHTAIGRLLQGRGRGLGGHGLPGLRQQGPRGLPRRQLGRRVGNLGAAATNNSNLLNTYSEVICRGPRRAPESAPARRSSARCIR